MLRVFAPPPVVLALLLPLQPEIPETTHTTRISPVAAYASRLLAGRRCCKASKTIINTENIPIGTSIGIGGLIRGSAKGMNWDKAVVSVAVHDAAPDAEAVAAVGVQVTAAPNVLDPFLNCTVPVG